MTIIFECKDTLLARHYDKEFREEFEAQLATKKTAAGREQCQRVWRREMLAHARRQEHYDYEYDEDGARVVIRNELGDPALLIPEIRIEK
jgi:hypothetical protein